MDVASSNKNYKSSKQETFLTTRDNVTGDTKQIIITPNINILYIKS